MPEQERVKPSTLIRQSEILRHAVIDSATLEALGRVEVLWMFPQVNRVLGIVAKPGLFGSTRLVFKLPQIKSVKAQILVQGEAEETTVDKVQKLESLLGSEVWSDGGDRIGTITDCLFDLDSGVIIRYLMVPNGQLPRLVAQFTDGIYLISPKQIKSFSPQRVLIAEETVDQLRLYSEGIRLKLATMTATLKQDYWDGATEEWRSLAHHVQSIAHKTADQVMSLAEKAKTTARNLSKTLAQKMSEVSESVTDGVEQVEEAIADEDQPWNDPEWADTLVETVKTKGKAVVSDVKDRGQPVIERLKTVQQTLQNSVVSHFNPQEGLADQQGRPIHSHETIKSGLEDERLDDEQLGDWGLESLEPEENYFEDDSSDDDWDDESVNSGYSVGASTDNSMGVGNRSESPDPWDDWADDHDAPNPQVPPSPQQSTHAYVSHGRVRNSDSPTTSVPTDPLSSPISRSYPSSEIDDPWDAETDRSSTGQG